MLIEQTILLTIFSVFLLVFFWTSLEGYVFKFTRLLETRSRGFLLVLALLSLAITAFFSHWILLDFPNSGDEYAYIFQAKTFFEGRLWNQTYPFQKFFTVMHIIERRDMWVSKVLPGWSALLAVGLLLKLPLWLVNPILGTLSLIVFFFLGSYLYSNRVAVFSVSVMLFSAFFIFNSSSYFTHTSCLLMILLFVYYARRYLSEGRYYQALLAGLFIGIAFTIRPYTALWCGLPLGILSLLSVSRKQYIGLLLIGCGALPFVIALLIYNQMITGDAFLPPFLWYFPKDTVGLFPMGTSFSWRAYQIPLRFYLLMKWSNPALLILFGVFLVATIFQGQRLQFEDLIFPSLVLGHLFYWHFGGNQYGPRYYYEAYPYLILFVVSRLLREDWWKSVHFRKLALSAFLSGFVIALLQIPSHAMVEHEVVLERMDVYRLVEKQHIRNAIIFLKPNADKGIKRPLGTKRMTRNGINLESDVLYAHDRGSKNQELKKYFPNKTFYVYSRGQDMPHGTLTALRGEE